MTNQPNRGNIGISVVIPTFNRAAFIGDAIRSVLEQSVPVTEILVVDGGSTDDTRKIAEGFGPLVHWLPQEGKGVAAARNTGFRRAKGDWIALLDSDDLWYKDKLRAQSDLLNLNPEIDFVFGDMALFTADADNDAPEILDLEAHQFLVSKADNLAGILEYLFRFNFVPTSSVLFRRSCLERVGYMDENLKHCEDYDYWLRFACHCRLGFVNRVLVKRRMHDANTMRGAYADNCEATLHVLEQMQGLVADAPEAVRRARLEGISLAHHRLGGYCFRQRDYVNADAHFRAVLGSGILPKGIEALKFYVKLLWTRSAKCFQN
jgi:glycosyltransferase involved in cell wall biosynthesis